MGENKAIAPYRQYEFHSYIYIYGHFMDPCETRSTRSLRRGSVCVPNRNRSFINLHWSKFRGHITEIAVFLWGFHGFWVNCPWSFQRFLWDRPGCTKRCPSVSPMGQHVENCLSHIGNAYHLGIRGKGMLNYRWMSPPLAEIPLTASENPVELHCVLKFRAFMGWPYLPILIQNLDG